jgi:hypothetical protein
VDEATRRIYLSVALRRNAHATKPNGAPMKMPTMRSIQHMRGFYCPGPLASVCIRAKKLRKHATLRCAPAKGTYAINVAGFLGRYGPKADIRSRRKIGRFGP